MSETRKYPTQPLLSSFYTTGCCFLGFGLLDNTCEGRLLPQFFRGIWADFTKMPKSQHFRRNYGIEDSSSPLSITRGTALFSYFGSKSRVVQYYPKPIHDTIIEPFCGSARYACRHGLNRDVWLNDKFKDVYDVWIWLRSCTRQDVLALPKLRQGDRIEDIEYLSPAEKKFIGFCSSLGAPSPSKVVTEWGAKNRHLARAKERAEMMAGHISHWKITNLDFAEVVADKPATYFVDPPYQFRGGEYRIRNGNNFYDNLHSYCMSVDGQVIVCENSQADWIEHQPLVKTLGQKRMSNEVMCEIANGKIIRDEMLKPLL